MQMFTLEDRFSDLAVAAELQRRRTRGYGTSGFSEKVLDLTSGSPDFPIANEVAELLAEHVRSGLFSYAPPQGLPAFRQAIAQRLLERDGLECSLTHILPVAGATHGLHLTAKYLLSPGDESVMIDPCNPVLRNAVIAAGGIPISCPLTPSTWELDSDRLKRSITQRTRLLMLCTPHSPTGHVFREDELTTIAEVAMQHNLYVVCDEVWSDLVFRPQQFVGMLSLGEEVCRKTFVIQGFGKSHGLGGLRIGALVMPNERTAREVIGLAFHDAPAAGAGTLAQAAVLATLQAGEQHIATLREHTYQMRNYAVDRIVNIPEVYCSAPESGSFLLTDIRSLGMKSEEVAATLLSNGWIGVTPITHQFGTGASGHIRISIATSHGRLGMAIDAMEKVILQLRSAIFW